jgi:CTP:phosphocholine cytidylyltransferase-like protein
MPKKFKSRHSVTVNTDTGEYEEEIVTNSWVTGQDEFMQVYVQDLAPLFQARVFNNKSKVLVYLWKIADKHTNEITLLVHDKERMVQELNLKSVNYVNQVIHQLTGADILLRLCRGKFQLNPKLFFKGSLIERQRILVKQDKYVIV